MLFNSLDFFYFLPIALALYYLSDAIFGEKGRILCLLGLSYTFYSFWNFKFLSLIIISTFFDYFLSRFIENSENNTKRKYLLTISIFLNLGLLFVFKYYNFFIDSFIVASSWLGIEIPPYYIEIILPVGISFYTFQTLSYTIDVYNREIAAEKDLVLYATYVSYFPQLVAGPIERAGNLLPRLKKIKFDISEAPLLILSGFVRKMVFADNFAKYVDLSWSNIELNSFSSLCLSSLFFSFQIYFDFSGYSRIARGVSLLFGVELIQNFNYPYTARGFVDFWRRWHISLTNWFRDYLYFPLGGSRVQSKRVVINILAVFIVSGLWHGAGFNFLLWGSLHGICMIVDRKYHLFHNRYITFLLVTLFWIPFRAPDIDTMILLFKNIKSSGIGNFSSMHLGLGYFELIYLLSLLIFAIYYLNMEKKNPKFILIISPLLIYFFSAIRETFIYFQF